MNTLDPLEQRIAEALTAGGIEFTRKPEETKNLDFYLPQVGVYIEVKGGHTPRIAEQCSRDHNIIVVQGVKATAFFCELLRG